MVTIVDIANKLATDHGEAVGIEVNGYPTSWCHSKKEIERIQEHLEQEKTNA